MGVRARPAVPLNVCPDVRHCSRHMEYFLIHDGKVGISIGVYCAGGCFI